MNVQLCLGLVERASDRMKVRLVASSGDDGPLSLEGASIRLYGSAGEPLTPRFLVNVPGELGAHWDTTVELRHPPELPEGAVIRAHVWSPHDTTECGCRVDSGTRLEGYLLGVGSDPEPVDAFELGSVDDERLDALASRLPWATAPVREAAHKAVVIEAQVHPSADDLRADFGLDDDDAQWLEELLDGDDDEDPLSDLPDL